MKSAQKTHVLITHVADFLGHSLAKAYLGQNCTVFGISSTHVPADILAHPDFTLLDLDLSQPLPVHLPPFDIIFHLGPYLAFRPRLQSEVGGQAIWSHHSATGPAEHLPQTSSLIAYAANSGSKLFILAPITQDPETINTGKNATLFLVGDVYGPGMSVNHSQSELTNLISQAAKSDKVILENEGLNPIYPAYIKDVIFALNRVVFSKDDEEKVHYLVSDPAQTALTCAYEIQSALAAVAGKDIGLFFSGPPAHPGPSGPPRIDINAHDLGFTPKFHLREGLKETFQYLQQDNQIETPTPTHHTSSSLPNPNSSPKLRALKPS